MRDARREELTYGAVLLALAVASILPVLIDRYGLSPTPASLLREGGVYEWVGAVACLLAALVMVRTFLRERGRGERPTLPLLLMAIVLFLLFGEEISWGQRLLGFDVPAWLARENYQREFTVHNLKLIQPSNNFLSNALFVGLNAYLCILPLALHSFPSLATAWRRTGIPTASIRVSFFVLVLYGLNRVAYSHFYPGGVFTQDIHHVGEIFESGVEVLLLVVAIERSRGQR